MKPFNPRHQQVVDYFNSYYLEHGRKPTIRQAADALGFSSTNFVLYALDRAKALGVKVEGKDPKGPQDPDILALEVCVRALTSCSPEGLRANLRYLIDRFGAGSPAGGDR